MDVCGIRLCCVCGRMWTYAEVSYEVLGYEIRMRCYDVCGRMLNSVMRYEAMRYG